MRKASLMQWKIDKYWRKRFHKTCTDCMSAARLVYVEHASPISRAKVHHDYVVVRNVHGKFILGKRIEKNFRKNWELSTDIEKTVGWSPIIQVRLLHFSPRKSIWNKNKVSWVFFHTSERIDFRNFKTWTNLRQD